VKYLVIVCLFVSCTFAKVQDPSGYQVTSVPGFTGDIPFDSYAGYFPVNDGDKMLFFWFVESQNDPANDPVVLWLNGGPGCSSFDGFVYEHGPFFFNSGPMGANQNLTLNPNSWNKVANMIYLDSPAGVGLSYSTNPDVDYNTGDKITAHDSCNFLQHFFSQFPEFQSNDFYIAGESYAGVYVPTLAQQVMFYNQQNPNNQMNLQGILVGNGVTDDMYDGNAYIPFIWGHSLIPDDLYNAVVDVCAGNYWNSSSQICNDLLYNASSYVADLNIYNIYEDCYGLGQIKVQEPMWDLRYRMKQRVRDAIKEERTNKRAPGDNVPCIDSSRAASWINQDSVRTAIHALPISQLNWTICSGAINYTEQYSTVIPIHEQLLENGYRLFIYSGDVDMCVPNTGTEAWTSSLGLTEVDGWRPWFVDSQVAGYVTEYKGLTYATIKGSGHTVPEYKPLQALAFFSRFLEGEPL